VYTFYGDGYETDNANSKYNIDFLEHDVHFSSEGQHLTDISDMEFRTMPYVDLFGDYLKWKLTRS
jgi:hypothetical protein